MRSLDERAPYREIREMIHGCRSMVFVAVAGMAPLLGSGVATASAEASGFPRTPATGPHQDATPAPPRELSAYRTAS